MKPPYPRMMSILLTPTDWLLVIGMTRAITVGQSVVAPPRGSNDNLKKV